MKILLSEGSRSLVENAVAEVKALAIGGKTLPILVVDTTPGNCDLCSPLAHHVRYAKDEVCLRVPGILKGFFDMAFTLFGGLLRLGHIDKVVYINNWLLSTNPCLELNAEELESIRRFIQRQYPSYAQVIRSIHPSLFPDQKKVFLDCDFSLLKSRDVFVWPADDDSYLERENFHRDSELLRKSRYEIVSAGSMNAEGARRLRYLYRGLYLEKHNTLNGWLTESFFETTFRNRTLHYHLLKDGDRIDGFYCFSIYKNTFFAVALGYDLSISRKEGIYRQLVASCIQEAKKRKLTLNLSAGVDVFKTLRGGKSIIEYEAVYDRHLSLRQRVAWGLLKLKCSLSARFLSVKTNLI